MDPRRSLDEIKSENDDHPEIQRMWEVSKIGSFDMDSWRLIFENLSDMDLANVSNVCKDFETMARNVFKNRYKGQLFFQMSFGDIGWRSVICRFRHEISHLLLIIPADSILKQEDFSYFERFLSETLRDLNFYQINAAQIKHIVPRRKFLKLEKLSFMLCNLTILCPLLYQICFWYPNLKSLNLEKCKIGKSKFLEQYLPLVEDVSLSTTSVNSDFFLIFIIRNRQLKHLFADLSNFTLEYNMSCLPIVNECLTKLESMIWSCSNLTLLPNFRNNFDNVKMLGFEFKYKGTYKNELLKIINYFPQLEDLKLLNCSQNLMTNDDLINLLTQSSSTLKKLLFVSRGMERELKFGYDLHRRVGYATLNRTDVQIQFEFGIPFDPICFLITEKWIKENGKFIVL